MSSLIYNGVRLVNVTTRRFDQRCCYDSTGTDLVCHEITLAVEGLIHREEVLSIGAGRLGAERQGPTPDGQPSPHGPWLPLTEATSVAEAHRIVRARLLRPRGTLVYGVGHATLLSVAGPPAAEGTSEVVTTGGGTAGPAPEPLVDVAGGPHPLSLAIEDVIGGRALKVVFEIRCDVAEPIPAAGDDGPPDAGETLDAAAREGLPSGQQSLSEHPPGQQVSGEQPPAPEGGDAAPLVSEAVLSHRWSLEEIRDEDFLVTHCLRGELIARLDRLPVHRLRALVTPPLAAGMVRTKLVFAADPDGRTLRYEVLDRQTHRTPPYPAIAWTAEQTVATGETGSSGLTTLVVDLTGPPNARKTDLLIAATQVVTARLGDLRRTLGQSPAGFGYVRRAVIREPLHENRVAVTVEIVRAGRIPKWLNLPLTGLATPIDGLTAPTTPTDESAPLPLPAAETPAAVFATYLQSPTDPVHGLPGLSRLTLSPPSAIESASPDSPPGEADSPEAPTVTWLPSPGSMPLDDPVSHAIGHVENLYTHAAISSRYDTQTGRRAFPRALAAAGPTEPTASIVTVHQPLTRRVLTCDASRIGDWPELPRAQDGLDANGIAEWLISERVEACAPELLPDGKTLLYRVRTVAVLALARTPRIGEMLRAGHLPTIEPGVRSPGLAGDHFVPE